VRIIIFRKTDDLSVLYTLDDITLKPVKKVKYLDVIWSLADILHQRSTMWEK